jgi:ribosome biogenesis GTPase A
MFPPSLFDHIVNDLGKRMIMVMNKIDLVPAELVLAWKKYFEAKYVGLQVLLFTSYPSYNLRGTQESNTGLKIRRRKGKQKMAIEGAEQVFQACKEIVKDAVDLSSWEQKILEETNAPPSTGDDDADEVIAEKMHEEDTRFAFEEHELYKNGMLTIGCLGFPNVGKSSLMNALIGKKVVSVSRTPGHTKHFQTIFLTNTVRLCDCPGLVFPSSTPRRIQVLMGSFPIAQLREPYASIRFMAERIDLPALLNVQHLEQSDHPDAARLPFSPIDICDSWAVKRGFLTARTGRPDTYRAANHLLRMALDGKLSICLRPKGFTAKKAEWAEHPELAAIQKVQALGKSGDRRVDFDDFSDSEDDESQARRGGGEGERSFEANTSGTGAESSEGEGRVSANPFSMLNDEEEEEEGEESSD